MDEPHREQPYLDVGELAARTGLSRATIWRLKKAGKIPFCQPGGKGSRVLFHADAIELTNSPAKPTLFDDNQARQPERLPGPRPDWMS